MRTQFCIAKLAGTAMILGLVAGPAVIRCAEVSQTEVCRSETQIRGDWLRQEQVRHAPPAQETITSQDDAAGGCDGVRDGSFGFCTSRESEPWWQVDLRRVVAIGQVLIYNRCDTGSERARHLQLLLSNDGRTWKVVYRHDGSLFGGIADRKPLSVLVRGARARYVRIQLPGTESLHLDEIEIFDTSYHHNYALGAPADQSSTSRWSTPNPVKGIAAPKPLRPASIAVAESVQRGERLADCLQRLGVDVEAPRQTLRDVQASLQPHRGGAREETQRDLYLRARGAVRRLAFSNPLLDFKDLLFVKRVPTSFTHMSDQYYGWFSRPGGGLYILQDFRGDQPTLRCLTADLPPGNIHQPDLSFDGTRILFPYCRYYPGLADKADKLDKSQIPEDAFYHLYEMRVDGTGLRRLTHGKYDDFDGRYLPDGDIVFLSTRKGQFLQAGKESAQCSGEGSLPDSYVRCGGGAERPVAVYTLHAMGGDGSNMRAISAFESFEWTPSITEDGRILYARWDYVDREAMPYLSLWSTLPDGTTTQLVYGNHTVNPYCVFEGRSIPGSGKLIFTASAHHAITGGSLVLLDPAKGNEGLAPLTRLTPEVPFPEIEAWPLTYFANPWPLSEDVWLTAWSDQPLAQGWPRLNPPNAMGLYLADRFGNLDLIYRDPEISSMYPLPLRARTRPPRVRGAVASGDLPEGRMLLLDVHRGLPGVERGTIRALRVVGVTPKTQPQMDSPVLGVTRNDPGKFVLGTVPVEADGSAHFQVPAGLPFFLQALDAEGLAVQTMRTVAYVQPGQTLTCVGCHESRHTAPPNSVPLASQRPASRLVRGPEGSWPLDFATLVQPVLQKHCVRCHSGEERGAGVDLTPPHAYAALMKFGRPNLRDAVFTGHRQGFSSPQSEGARASVLRRLLQQGHYESHLDADDWQRLVTWMDTYAQRSGSFSTEQTAQLEVLRERLGGLLTP